MDKNSTARLPITTSQDLTAGPLSYTTTLGRKFRLVEINIKFSENVTETITITRDSGAGANYDTLLKSTSVVAQTSFVWRPEGDCDFSSLDALKIQCTNANVTGTAYVTIKTRELE